MEEVVGSKVAKEIDNYTINTVGIPSILLMENAAERIYSAILHKGDHFVVFCGVGNNGGDGLAIARKLIQNEKNVSILIVGNLESASEEFIINYNILKNIRANIFQYKEDEAEVTNIIMDCDVIVDAIFGIGLNREIKGKYYNAIKLINSSIKKIVSVDIPSGLDSDDGKIHGICVKATETYTIGMYKKGFISYDAKKYLGNVNLIKIGIPKEVINKYSEGIKILSEEEYKLMVPIRKIYGHKGNYGKILILAGSREFTGAAYITTEATVNCGSGLVSLVVEDEIYDSLSNKMIEAMTIRYSEKDRIDKLLQNADVIACGPGLSKNTINVNMLVKFIENSTCKLILDADAINILSENKDLFSKIKNRSIITPHLGEMARLIGRDIDYVEKNRLEVCRKFSKENNLITVLKGYNTVISDGDKTIINCTGSSKMASGGMGDCLTGIIASLLGQNVSLFESAILGTYIHGLTGDILGKDKYTVKARDIINNISLTLESLIKKNNH
ncbi:MAG: NAD(P)H-hydrate dehydratase [Clostridiales bacterium]|nr:NAD(P)H-hydrate dehydratase [Clostridiales bacterium]